jgi:hypothetical protein
LRQFKEAEELGLVVVEKRERIFGEHHSQTVRAMSNLAHTYNESTGESPRTWYCGDEKAHTTLGKQPSSYTMTRLANTSNQWGKLKEAEKLAMSAMKKQRQVLGEDHPMTLWTMFALVNTYHQLGRWKKAEELAVFVMKKLGQIQGKDHPETVWIMTELVSMYQKLGRATEAQVLSKDIDRILRKV